MTLEQEHVLNSLRAKEAEIAADLCRRDGLTVETAADALDEIQDAIDRALLIRNLDHCSRLLREIHLAIDRVGTGEYGQCLECGEEINPKRLAVVPWAALCLRCQENADSKSTMRNGNWFSVIDERDAA